MQALISWFTRNDVAANLLMLGIIIAGLYSALRTIPLEVFPSFTTDNIEVTLVYSGAAPEDIERGLVEPVEQELRDLENIESITARVNEGSAVVILELSEGTNKYEMLQDVRNRLDTLTTLPPDSEEPLLTLPARSREVISAVIWGDLDSLQLRALGESIRSDLLKGGGITQITLSDERNHEIAIEISELELRRYDLSLEQVAQSISAQSVDLSSGTVGANSGDVLLRTRSQAQSADEFADIVIRNNPDGSRLLLGEIAQISEVLAESDARTQFNGKPALELEIYRVGSQSATEVAQLVKDYVAAQQDDLPQGVNLSIWRDNSKVIKSRLTTLVDSAVQGGILVILLLMLFLRPGVAFWVAWGIPICFLGSFWIISLFDGTFNVVSLFAFILVLGIVVDDAIVTGENVYSHLRRGAEPLQAAIKGTQEIAVPVIFGILTTIAAFLPIFWISGARGQIFAQIPMVVIPVLLFSLVESKLILPAHLKHVRAERGKGWLMRLQARVADSLEWFIARVYVPVLGVALRWRYSLLVLFFSLAALTVVSLQSGWTQFIFFPRIESEVARATLTMPQGTPAETVDLYTKRMVDSADRLRKKYSEGNRSVIVDILASINDNSARVIFEILPAEERFIDVGARQLIGEWRRQIGLIPGAEELNFRAEIGRGGSPVDVQLSGKNNELLISIADQVRDWLSRYPGVFDIEDSYSNGKEEMRIKLKPAALALGLSVDDVARQLRQAFQGIEVQSFVRSGLDYTAVLRYPSDERNSLAAVDRLSVATPNGGRIALSELVDFDLERGPASIYRIDLERTLTIRADINKEAVNDVVLKQELDQFVDSLVAGTNISYSLEGEAREQRESFGSLRVGALFAFMMIFVLLAIPLKSYVQPFIVLSAVPIALIGAVLGHFLMGYPLTIFSIVGMLALSGVAVNDSLVLVDFINRYRKSGQDHRDAAIKAASARFRAILLTSLTTFFGLLPLMFAQSVQAQFLIPMAISLGYGILFATFVTLLLVPINYLVLQDIKGIWRWYWGLGRKRAAPAPVPAEAPSS